MQPAELTNPYPGYERLRRETPVFWEASPGMWTITRYADVQAILRDPRFLAARVGDNSNDPVQAALLSQMLFSDPPQHTRLRGLVSQAFTPRVIAQMRADIQSWTDALLDEAAPAGCMEVMAALAQPLPVTVIAQMLGVPPTDRARFQQWSHDYIAVIGGLASDDHNSRLLRSLLELSRYLKRIIAQLRQAPSDCLLSLLASAEEAGDKLSEDELLANALLLLAAGHETTTNLIGNGLLALLGEPSQWQKLKENPSLIPSAVEELLRFDSPVQWTGREAGEDLEWGGQTIKKGDFVNLGLGAANRDPAQFSEPDKLDIERTPNRHLAFGYGPHFCLGAVLARMEGEIVFTTLTRRFPNMTLDADELTWQENRTFRGVLSLPVILEP